MSKIATINVTEFVNLARSLPVFDVRSPAEFEKGHFPGAFNLPLFSNEEREAIGKTYKRVGKEAAMLEGLDFVGPRMRQLIDIVVENAPAREALLHCWRGGMRSNSVAWLLTSFGFKVIVLDGGYKAFRRYVLNAFEQPKPMLILSGHTGAGKTAILYELAGMQEQILDLEKIAHHKGSSFGSLGEAPQPTQQQFENQLAINWMSADPHRLVWIEDESRNIGSKTIPKPFWLQMRAAQVIFLKMPATLRSERLKADYGAFPKNDLRLAIERLTSKLGGARTQEILTALEDGDLSASCRMLLNSYYDKTYEHGISKRDPANIHVLDSNSKNPAQNARQILDLAGAIRNGISAAC